MTVDHETVEVLRGEPELLAIADALQTAAARLEAPLPASGAVRRRIGIGAAAVVAVAVLLGLLLASPWESGGPSLVDWALAAVGDRPVLHVVLVYSVGERLDLVTGESRPAPRQLEIWYDADRHVFRTIVSADGHVLSRTEGSGDLQMEPFMLSELYRRALQEGKLHKTGEALIRGRPVILVDAPAQNGTLVRAALDAGSFQLVRMQFLRENRIEAQLDVLRYETVSRDQAGLPAPGPGSPQPTTGVTSGGTATSGSRIGLEEAATLFGATPLWPGPAVDGRSLDDVQVESVSDTREDRKASGRKLLLSYGAGPRGSDPYVEVEEAPADSPLWEFESVFPPPEGFVDLTSGETSIGGNVHAEWTGVLRKGGFYVRLTSASRPALVAAAGALQPLP